MKKDLILVLFIGLLTGVVILIFLPVLCFLLDVPRFFWVGYSAFSSFCHQLSERSFHIRGVQLSVCGRCTGIYVGMFAGALFYIILKKPLIRLSLMLIFLMGVDGILNALGIIESSIWIRFITGLGFGIGSGILLGYSIYDLVSMLEEEDEWRTGSII